MGKEKITVAVVCATPAEYLHCRDVLQLQKEKRLKGRMLSHFSNDRLDLSVIKAGLGKTQCASATQLVIDALNPDLIIDAGTAGSLISTIPIGSIVCAQYCYEYDIDPHEKFPPIANNLTTMTLTADVSSKASGIFSEFIQHVERSDPTISIRLGNLASGEKNVNDRVTREKLREAYNAIACDWETFTILKTASYNKVNTLSFRAITDNADIEMSVEYKANLHKALEKLGHVLRLFLCEEWVHRIIAADH